MNGEISAHWRNPKKQAKDDRIAELEEIGDMFYGALTGRRTAGAVNWKLAQEAMTRWEELNHE